MGISVCDFNTFPVQLACQGQEKEVGQFQLHIREWESVGEEKTEEQKEEIGETKTEMEEMEEAKKQLEETDKEMEKWMILTQTKLSGAGDLSPVGPRLQAGQGIPGCTLKTEFICSFLQCMNQKILLKS